MQVIPWYRLGLYEKAMPPQLSFVEMMKSTHLAQFDFIELSVDETDQRLSRLDWSLPERDRLCHDMELTGIRLETMCLSGHRKYPLGSPDASTRQRGLEIMEKAIDLSIDLGIRIIQNALDLGVRRFTSEFWYLGESNWQDNLRAASQFLRAHFPQST